MGAMGYDAVTVGNHEFDGTGSGFGEMLTAARRSGDVTPALLLANYRPEEDSLDLQRAMAAYGVEESLLLERGGVTYGIFGLMGRTPTPAPPHPVLCWRTRSGPPAGVWSGWKSRELK